MLPKLLVEKGILLYELPDLKDTSKARNKLNNNHPEVVLRFLHAASVALPPKDNGTGWFRITRMEPAFAVNNEPAINWASINNQVLSMNDFTSTKEFAITELAANVDSSRESYIRERLKSTRPRNTVGQIHLVNGGIQVNLRGKWCDVKNGEHENHTSGRCLTIGPRFCTYSCLHADCANKKIQSEDFSMDELTRMFDCNLDVTPPFKKAKKGNNEDTPLQLLLK